MAQASRKSVQASGCCGKLGALEDGGVMWYTPPLGLSHRETSGDARGSMPVNRWAARLGHLPCFHIVRVIRMPPRSVGLLVGYTSSAVASGEASAPEACAAAAYVVPRKGCVELVARIWQAESGPDTPELASARGSGIKVQERPCADGFLDTITRRVGER